jgi:uncharacterized protein YkwD
MDGVKTRWAAMAAILLGSASPIDAQTVAPGFHEDIATIEREVLVALNAARANPAGYAATLQAYRANFRGKIVTEPGSDTDTETVEGVAPVDEAIAFLGRLKPLGTIAAGTTIQAAAGDHAREQAVSGRTGHFSPEGKGPAERNARHNGGREIAEVIAYGAGTADEVIRELIVDDGVSDRGHRKILFAQHLKYAGIACGPHPSFGTMCVIDMADTPDGN